MYNIQWGDTSYPRSFQRFDLGVSFQRFVSILRTHILLTFLGHTETYINAIATFLVELWEGPRSCDWAHHGCLLALYHANEFMCGVLYLKYYHRVKLCIFIVAYMSYISSYFYLVYHCTCCTMINLFVSFVTNSSLIKKW